MKLVTFQRPGAARPEAGYVNGDSVVSLSAVFADVVSILSGGAEALAKAAAVASPSYGLPSVKLMAPIPRPPKIICIGLNYRDHAIETNMKIPEIPTVFCKFQTAVIGRGTT